MDVAEILVRGAASVALRAHEILSGKHLGAAESALSAAAVGQQHYAGPLAGGDQGFAGLRGNDVLQVMREAVK